MATSHYGHSTYSAGKENAQSFQKLYCTGKGKTVLTLVGDSSGLPRHINLFRSMGYETIYVYESDPACARSLYEAKHDLYKDDNGVIIRWADALTHDFEKEPIDFIDFDAVASFGNYLHYKDDVYFALDLLFKSTANVISLTCSSRTYDRSKIDYIGDDWGHSQTQWEIATTWLALKYPNFHFTIFAYKGCGGEDAGYSGSPMFNIVGVRHDPFEYTHVRLEKFKKNHYKIVKFTRS